MVINRSFSRLALIAGISLIGVAAHAQLSFTGTTLTENFDSLASSGNGNAWSNGSTLSGWSLFRQPAAGPVAITTYNAGTGSSNAGNFWSYGSAANDRALGGLGSGGAYFGSPATGTVAGWIAVAITNNTGGTLSSFTVGYDGEQWRDGGANGGTPAAQTMVLEYGYGATFGAVTTWTAAGAGFNFTSPIFTNTTTGAAVDGNAAGLVAGLGGTVTGQTWNSGDTLWVRWIESNDAGNDHGLSVDNFSFSTAAVPEPGTFALLGLAALPGVALLRRRK